MTAGVPAREVEDWTEGELCAQAEGHRRHLQALAAMAYRETLLSGAVFNPKMKRLPEVYEAFPFWTEDEIKDMKLQKYRAIMMRHVARGGGGK